MEPLPPGRSSPTAWQPFTFGGVAAFASVSTAWLWVLLLLTALGLGWGVVSYLQTACYPAVEAALQRLPPTAGIRKGTLSWPTNSAVELANTRLLALLVNPGSAPVPGQGADVVLELTDRALTAQSLFGYWVLPYPARADVPLSRAELEPLWAAWEPHLRVVLPVVVVAAFVVAWGLVATLVAPVLRLGVAVLRRAGTLAGCWRMALAAFVPAGCGTALGLVLYASRGFHLTDTLITWLIAHLYTVVLWVGAVASLPRRSPRSPFVGGAEASPPAGGAPEAPAVSPPVQEASPFAEPPPPAVPRNPFAGPPSGAGLPEPPSLPVSALARPRAPASAPPPAAPTPASSGSAPGSQDEEGPFNPS